MDPETSGPYKIQCEHNHDSVCDRWQSLQSTLNDIKHKAQTSKLPDVEKGHLLHEFQLLETDILAWKSHLLKAVNQELGKQDVLSQLGNDGALVIMD